MYIAIRYVLSKLEIPPSKRGDKEKEREKAEEREIKKKTTHRTELDAVKRGISFHYI